MKQPLQRGFPKWDWRSLPFVLMHVGAVVLPFFTTFSWNLVALAIGLYLVRMFALTGFYHRYFSHRSFKTSRAFQFVMAVWGLTCVQKGPLWWAANHRHHHKHSDQHGDVHSPGLQGFIWAHMGWIMGDDWHDTNLEGVPDLVKYPELRWLDKYHLVPGVAMGVLCYLIGGFPVLVWGFIVSTVINWHVTFMINSLTHMFGRRRYPTKDDSRNSFILALLTLGEGWHNNHHYYQASTRQGFFWWEIDITYYGLKGSRCARADLGPARAAAPRRRRPAAPDRVARSSSPRRTRPSCPAKRRVDGLRHAAFSLPCYICVERIYGSDRYSHWSACSRRSAIPPACASSASSSLGRSACATCTPASTSPSPRPPATWRRSAAPGSSRPAATACGCITAWRSRRSRPWPPC